MLRAPRGEGDFCKNSLRWRLTPWYLDALIGAPSSLHRRKGKPVARWGRKVTGLYESAGPPNRSTARGVEATGDPQLLGESKGISECDFDPSECALARLAQPARSLP